MKGMKWNMVEGNCRQQQQVLLFILATEGKKQCEACDNV